QYNSNGSLDGSFGTGGVVITSLTNGQYFIVGGVTLAPGGKIVVAGTTDTPSFQPVSLTLVEYNSNGTLNQGFGSGGIVSTPSFQTPGGLTCNQTVGNDVVI